jgi:hypothetical protein
VRQGIWSPLLLLVPSAVLLSNRLVGTPQREAVWLGFSSGLFFGVVRFAAGDSFESTSFQGLLFGGLMTPFYLWRAAHPPKRKEGASGSLSDWLRLEFPRGTHDQSKS